MEASTALALWTQVVSAALAWWRLVPDADPWGVALLARWVELAAAWSAEGGALEDLCTAAERVRVGAPWPLAWAVRAGTASAVLEARRGGHWPAWRAVPFRASLVTHPPSLALAVLEWAAETSGREPAEALALWRRLAPLHGICP